MHRYSTPFSDQIVNVRPPFDQTFTLNHSYSVYIIDHVKSGLLKQATGNLKVPLNKERTNNADSTKCNINIWIEYRINNCWDQTGKEEDTHPNDKEKHHKDDSQP